jgi:hypothetical protein
MNRRQFLIHTAQTASALVLSSTMLRIGRAHAASPSPSPQAGYTLPDHLPQRLSIGMFIWNWITMATPEEPYHDLEKAVAGLRERGFNAVRLEAGLNWCFRVDGRTRGEMTFGPSIPGFRGNLIGNAVGGGRHDVLRRLVRLTKLAREHGIYVILTSWEYQDSTWSVADPKIRAEVMGVPEAQRFMHLARQHDRLLRILKDEGLQNQIAYIEVHNEPDASRFPQGLEGKNLHTDAIAFLRNRHGDILVSGDYTSHNPSLVPDNVQVYDQHTYVPLLYNRLYAETVDRKDFDPADPKKNPLLRRLLKTPFVPYGQFMKAAENIGTAPWRPRFWMYYNLDNQAFDRWMLEQYQCEESGMKATAVGMFEGDAKEASRRNVPAVCDEGGYFYPPLGSKFEVTPPGTNMFDLQVDLAIKHRYWGMMPTTYCGPEDPIWQDVPWLQTINRRFQTGRTLT